MEKKPVNIKQDIPSAGKICMSRFGYNSLFNANSSAKETLPLDELLNTVEAKGCFAVAELQQNIVTGSLCVCENVDSAERFSLLDSPNVQQNAQLQNAEQSADSKKIPEYLGRHAVYS